MKRSDLELRGYEWVSELPDWLRYVMAGTYLLMAVIGFAVFVYYLQQPIERFPIAFATAATWVVISRIFVWVITGDLAGPGAVGDLNDQEDH